MSKKGGKNGNAACSTRYHSHGVLSQENDRSRTADLLCIMANSPDLVAKALNRLTDEVFTDVLTEFDCGSLLDLVYKLLCSAPNPSDADDSGKIMISSMNIHKNFALSESNSGVLDGFGILEELDLGTWSSSYLSLHQLLTSIPPPTTPRDHPRVHENLRI